MYQARKRADQCLGPVGWRCTGCRRKQYPHGALLGGARRAWVSVWPVYLKLDWHMQNSANPKPFCRCPVGDSVAINSRDWRSMSWELLAGSYSRPSAIFTQSLFGCTDLSRAVAQRATG